MTIVVKGLVLLAFSGLVIGLIALLPDYDLPPQIATAIQGVISASFWANRYLPIDTALYIQGAVLLTEFTVWAWKNGTKIISRLASILS